MNKEILKELARRIRFHGVAKITRGDQVVWEEAFGKACVEFDIDNTTKTLFRIASVSKQITAALVLKLHEQGRLSIDSSIRSYFPDYPNANQITIHHLLSNSSGIPNFDLSADFYPAFHRDDYFQGLVDMFKDLPVRFAPGHAYEYSNSGYLLLSRIVELVTEKPFEEALRTHLFEPLGMTYTGFDHWKEIVLGKAFPYDLQDQTMVRAEAIDLRIAAGGGALYSNLSDLSKWNDALYSHRILSKEITDMMLTPKVRINETTHYGYGMFLETSERDGRRIVRHYHSGGGPGVRSINAVYPEKRLSIIVLSNVNDRRAFLEFLDALERFALDDLT
jgi:CubicO group peptidase (beta-lactamase class C family)